MRPLYVGPDLIRARAASCIAAKAKPWPGSSPGRRLVDAETFP
jgi:hypothetical protein